MQARERDIHLRRMFSRSTAGVSPLSSSLNIGFRFSLSPFSSDENQLRRFGSCGKLNPWDGVVV